MKNIFILFVIIITIQTKSLIAKKIFINSETGFDGAVKVESKQEKKGLIFFSVTIPYIGMNGEKIKGQARFYYNPKRLKSKNKIPVYCGLHYESSEQTIKNYCNLGFAVVTPYFENFPIEFPFGNSYNFSKAMIQWARRLPFVDRSKLVFGGSSGGGYMTLAMGSEFFPLSSLVSDLPCVNWAYGCNYLLVNQKSSGCLLPADKPKPLPVLALIAPGATLARTIFEKDLKAETWYTLSPISYVDRITAPTMVTAATGDMLCTIDMFTSKKMFTLDKKLFPKNYVRNFEKLTLNSKARITLDEAISKENFATHIIPLPKKIHQFTKNDKKILDDSAYDSLKQKEINRPWSKDKQWNLVILNEGAPLPFIGHNRYYWNSSANSFVNFYKNKKVDMKQLNVIKLQRLLERYSGKLSKVAKLASGKKANRLNFEKLEKLDVVTGLLDYANTSPTHAKFLRKLYNKSLLKPFGKVLNLKQLEKLAAF
ncbi:MAG: alpha/beta hydrolase family protein [Alphaproteobacteria bacterium]